MGEAYDDRRKADLILTFEAEKTPIRRHVSRLSCLVGSSAPSWLAARPSSTYLDRPGSRMTYNSYCSATLPSCALRSQLHPRTNHMHTRSDNVTAMSASAIHSVHTTPLIFSMSASRMHDDICRGRKGNYRTLGETRSSTGRSPSTVARLVLLPTWLRLSMLYLTLPDRDS